MSVLAALAPAKVNLGLFVGPVRTRDRRHELATVMQSISLADELTLEPAGAQAGPDEVLCPGLPGEPGGNLAAAALAAFRAATGWAAPPLRLRIEKRIPVAAGLGGGSADAAAALRLARAASGLGDEQLLRRLGAELGADVPAQISPGRWLAAGAGEELQPLPPPRPPLGVLVLALARELPTGAVYEEADRLSLARSREELARVRSELAAALGRGAPLPTPAELLHNDLQRAAVSLCPQIADALEQARAAGAEQAFVSGSGPTVLGVFAGTRDRGLDGPDLAARAAATLADRAPAAVFASSVIADFGRPRSAGELPPPA